MIYFNKSNICNTNLLKGQIEGCSIMALVEKEPLQLGLLPYDLIFL